MAEASRRVASVYLVRNLSIFRESRRNNASGVAVRDAGFDHNGGFLPAEVKAGKGKTKCIMRNYVDERFLT